MKRISTEEVITNGLFGAFSLIAGIASACLGIVALGNGIDQKVAKVKGAVAVIVRAVMFIISGIGCICLGCWGIGIAAERIIEAVYRAIHEFKYRGKRLSEKEASDEEEDIADESKDYEW